MRRPQRLGVVALLLTLALATSGSAQSQAPVPTTSGADPWSNVEEMIVTGQSGVAALLDVPTSIVAFDQEYLSAVGALNISDLADYTPNLEINSPYAASNPQIFIRGVGLQDSASNASAAVAVVVDGIYLNSPAGQLSSLYDIESVEVLRGPQGAFYGRNASAGVVRVTTAAPVHEVKAGTNVTYGRFNQLEVDGFVNVPIVQDVLATRFAFKYTARDPLGENRCYEDRDNPPVGLATRLFGTKCYVGMVVPPRRSFNDPIAKPPKDTHDRENWYARSVWLLEPNEELSFNLNFHGGQNLGLAPQFQNRGTNAVNDGTVVRPDLTAAGSRYVDYDTCHAFDALGNCLRNDRFAGAGDPFSGDYSAGGKERLTLGGITLNSKWASGAWSFENVAGVEYNDREVVIDFDASPFREADAFITDSAWQVLEQAQLVWNGDTGLEVTLGAQYFHERLEADNLVWNTPQSALSQAVEQATDAAAAFFYLEYELSETVIFEGGARANYERKNFLISTAYNPYNNNTFGPPLAGYEDRRELAEQVKPSGEIIMRWEPTDDIKLYTRFSRGYKGQHFNGNALSTAQPIEPVKAENLNAFEMGWGTSFFDGIINWNGAGFYYDYENQQVYQLLADGVPVPVPVLTNAEDSRLLGAESDVTIAWEGIRFFNSIGIIYGEYSDFRIVNQEVSVSLGGGVTIQNDVNDYSGNRLVNAPEFTLVGYLLYDWELPIGGKLTPRVDYRYKERVFYTPENDSRIGADPRWIFDLRMDYTTAAGNITIGSFIRNVMDEYYPITAYDRKKRVGSIVYVVSEPRTYGLTISLKY